jgi:hypothetical protein
MAAAAKTAAKTNGVMPRLPARWDVPSGTPDDYL